MVQFASQPTLLGRLESTQEKKKIEMKTALIIAQFAVNVLALADYTPLMRLSAATF